MCARVGGPVLAEPRCAGGIELPRCGYYRVAIVLAVHILATAARTLASPPADGDARAVRALYVHPGVHRCSVVPVVVPIRACGRLACPTSGRVLRRADIDMFRYAIVYRVDVRHRLGSVASGVGAGLSGILRLPCAPCVKSIMKMYVIQITKHHTGNTSKPVRAAADAAGIAQPRPPGAQLAGAASSALAECAAGPAGRSPA